MKHLVYKRDTWHFKIAKFAGFRVSAKPVNKACEYFSYVIRGCLTLLFIVVCMSSVLSTLLYTYGSLIMDVYHSFQYGVLILHDRSKLAFWLTALILASLMFTWIFRTLMTMSAEKEKRQREKIQKSTEETKDGESVHVTERNIFAMFCAPVVFEKEKEQDE